MLSPIIIFEIGVLTVALCAVFAYVSIKEMKRLGESPDISGSKPTATPKG